MVQQQPETASWVEIADRPTPYATGQSLYRVFVEGLQRKDGTWAGRVVFADGNRVVRTGQETSQPNRQALEYWATGLEAIYLDGAFKRASSGARRS